MISSFECAKCGSWQNDIEDLVDHLVNWHDIELKSTEFYVNIAKSIDNLNNAIQNFDDEEEKRDEEREKIEEREDKDDNSFGGFSGGSFSGGGANSNW